MQTGQHTRFAETQLDVASMERNGYGEIEFAQYREIDHRFIAMENVQQLNLTLAHGLEQGLMHRLERAVAHSSPQNPDPFFPLEQAHERYGLFREQGRRLFGENHRMKSPASGRMPKNATLASFGNLPQKPQARFRPRSDGLLEAVRGARNFPREEAATGGSG